MNIFLKAKHWQLFILFFAIPFILQMVMIMLGILKAVRAEQTDPAEMYRNTYQMILFMLPFMVILYGWFWSIGTGLQDKLPSYMDMNVVLFKYVFLFYLAAISTYMYFLFRQLSITSDSIFPYDISLLLKLMPLYLLSMAGMFYCLYFMAKTLKSVELQREARFVEYLPELLLLWIYPVGVWFIQPKVNRWVQDPPHFPDLPERYMPPNLPPVPKV